MKKALLIGLLFLRCSIAHAGDSGISSPLIDSSAETVLRDYFMESCAKLLFLCPHCPRMTTPCAPAPSIEQHVQKTHAGERSEDLLFFAHCPVCSEVFDYKTLFGHMTHVHAYHEVQNAAQHPQVNSAFVVPAELLKTILVTAGNYPFIVDQESEIALIEADLQAAQ